jgi:hypothetical protein
MGIAIVYRQVLDMCLHDVAKAAIAAWQVLCGISKVAAVAQLSLLVLTC